MSYRNGDKSREHRLRKAREKKRQTIRGMQSKDAAKPPASTGSQK
jgi:hypothetical protein